MVQHLDLLELLILLKTLMKQCKQTAAVQRQQCWPCAYLFTIRACPRQLNCITISMIYALGSPNVLIKAFGSAMQGVLAIVGS